MRWSCWSQSMMWAKTSLKVTAFPPRVGWCPGVHSLSQSYHNRQDGSMARRTAMSCSLSSQRVCHSWEDRTVRLIADTFRLTQVSVYSRVKNNLHVCNSVSPIIMSHSYDTRDYLPPG